MKYYLGILDILVGYLYTEFIMVLIGGIPNYATRTHSAMMSIEYFSVLCKNIK